MLAEILRQAPCNLTEYRLNRIADWSQPRMDVDDVLCIHQLMQEYLAARCLANAPDTERVRTV